MEKHVIWIDVAAKIASFHKIERGEPVEFERQEQFEAYLYSLAELGYRFQ